MHIKVGPHKIQIVFVEDIDGYGEIKELPWTIRIKKSLSGRDTAMTLLHEVLHAIESIYGLTLGENKIRLLETTLSQIVIDNPEEARFWLKGLIDETDGQRKSNSEE